MQRYCTAVHRLASLPGSFDCLTARHVQHQKVDACPSTVHRFALLSRTLQPHSSINVQSTVHLQPGTEQTLTYLLDKVHIIYGMTSQYRLTVRRTQAALRRSAGPLTLSDAL